MPSFLTASHSARLGSAICLLVLANVAVALQQPPSVQHLLANDATDRIVVKLKSAYRTTAKQDVVQALSADRASALAVTAGIALRPVRPMSDDAQVLALPTAMRADAAQAIVGRLRNDPTVEYAYVDARDHLMAVPNDPLFSQQTYLQVPGAAPTVDAANAPGAWDITKGTGTAVVAVVDGGMRYDHPDLAGRTINGYDFVSPDCTIGTSGCTAANAYSTANDGDGRDADASDPGDWVSASDVATNPFFEGCDVENSSWHGTHVAGIIGAAGNNSLGITGLNWNAQMLSVRVSGKCGAYRSDIIDGIRWAVGIAVPNVPNNTRPARILNISLGSAGDCSASLYASAVSDVLATGAVIVAAAGNENSAVIQPANCSGVISVGATRGDGARTVYSNTGANLTIMAPGGDYYSATNDLMLSTNNAGLTTPLGYSSAGYYASLAGTSFSTPVVTGVVSLMLSINPNLTSSQVITLLRQTARAFTPVAGLQACTVGGSGNDSNTTPCNCTTAACGAGYVDATAAVTQAYILGGGSVATTTGSGSSGHGGGGAIDPIALVILAMVALATRSLRARPQEPIGERGQHATGGAPAVGGGHDREAILKPEGATRRFE